MIIYCGAVQSNKVKLSYLLKVGEKHTHEKNPVYTAQVIEFPRVILQGTIKEIRRNAPIVTTGYLAFFSDLQRKLKVPTPALKDSGYGIVVKSEQFQVSFSLIKKEQARMKKEKIIKNLIRNP